MTKSLLYQLSPDLLDLLEQSKGKKSKEVVVKEKNKSTSKEKNKKNKKQEYNDNNYTDYIINSNKQDEDSIIIGTARFPVKKVKGKKEVQLYSREFLSSVKNLSQEELKKIPNMKGKIIYPDNYQLLAGEKLSLIIKLARNINLNPISENAWNKKLNINIYEQKASDILVDSLDNILKVAGAKKKNKENGFICLFSDGKGTYWYKISRGFITALNESLASLETLAEETEIFTEEQLEKINNIYRLLTSLYKD